MLIKVETSVSASKIKTTGLFIGSPAFDTDESNGIVSFRSHNSHLETIPVTVCVAAICWGGDTIIGASDRMITSRDIQFEPETSKSLPLTNSMVAMLADDAGVQGEIYNLIRPEIHRRIADNPDSWVSVTDIAHLWATSYSEIRFREAENSILRPLALDRVSFYAKQHEMSDEFIREIGNQLLQFSIGGATTIITGVDDSGPHIYLVQNERSYSQDRIGFAAIGIGSRHANSQMMFRGHTPAKGLAESLLSVYMAKKRADEVSPGVGESTDIFSIGPQPGTYGLIASDIRTSLHDEYRRLRESENQATANAEGEMREHVNRFFQAQAREVRAEQEAAPEGAEDGARTVDEQDAQDAAVKHEPEVEH